MLPRADNGFSFFTNVISWHRCLFICATVSEHRSSFLYIANDFASASLDFKLPPLPPLLEEGLGLHQMSTHYHGAQMYDHPISINVTTIWASSSHPGFRSLFRDTCVNRLSGARATVNMVEMFYRCNKLMWLVIFFLHIFGCVFILIKVSKN